MQIDNKPKVVEPIYNGTSDLVAEPDPAANWHCPDGYQFGGSKFDWQTVIATNPAQPGHQECYLINPSD